VADTIFQVLSDFFARYGYAVVFLGVMVENVGVPVPGETVLLFAGFLAYHHRLHILPTILMALVGATLGAVGGYLIGRTPLVDRLVQRYPRLAQERNAAQQTVMKYSRWAVFASRFITGLRVFAALLAGALHMPFATFLLFTFLGAVCWSLAIGYVGYLFGSSWERLVSLVSGVNRILLVGIAAAALVTWAVYHLRRKKTA